MAQPDTTRKNPTTVRENLQRLFKPCDSDNVTPSTACRKKVHGSPAAFLSVWTASIPSLSAACEGCRLSAWPFTMSSWKYIYYLLKWEWWKVFTLEKNCAVSCAQSTQQNKHSGSTCGFCDKWLIWLIRWLLRARLFRLFWTYLRHDMLNVSHLRCFSQFQD